MVRVRFLAPIMKGGKVRQPDEEMELPDSTAALLAEKGVLEIPGKKTTKVKEEVEVVKIIDEEASENK